MNIQQLANLLIGKDGYVKICDYGFNRNNPELSQQLSDFGTPIQYALQMMIHNNSMAPELFSGHNANNTVDVYSFGCIILEILTNTTIILNLRELTQRCLIEFIVEGNRPFIPDNLPESINKSIDINHRV